MSIGVLDGISGAKDGGIDRGGFVVGEFPEHVIDQIASRSTDADPETGHGLGGLMNQDGLETIVAAGASGETQAQIAQGEAHIVKHDKNLGGRETMIPRVIADSLTAKIHESLRFHEQAASSLGRLGIPLWFEAEFHGGTTGQLVEDEKADIMPGAMVLATGIAETGDKAEDGGIFHAGAGGLFFLGRSFPAFRLLLLDDFGSSGGLSGGGFIGNGRLGHEEDRKIGVLGGGDASGKLDILHMKRLADIESGDVHGNDLGKILRQTPDGQRAHILLEEAAIGLDADGFASGLERNLGLDLLSHGDCVEIDVEDFSTDGMMLDLLDEGEAVGDLGSVGDLEFDEDILTHGMSEKLVDFLAGDFEVGRSFLASVDDCRDGTASAHLFHRIATGLGARAGREFNLFGHDLLRVLLVLNVKERAHRFIIMNAPNALTEQSSNRQDLHTGVRIGPYRYTVGGDQFLDF